MSHLAFEITEAQLLISGLVSGITVVGVVVRWLLTSLEREAAAYQRGQVDEQTRCQEDITELRKQMSDVLDENAKFRNAIFKLVIASDLNAQQRKDIAITLGYTDIQELIVNQKVVEGGNEPKSTG